MSTFHQAAGPLRAPLKPLPREPDIASLGNQAHWASRIWLKVHYLAKSYWAFWVADMTTTPVIQASVNITDSGAGHMKHGHRIGFVFMYIQMLPPPSSPPLPLLPTLNPLQPPPLPLFPHSTTQSTKNKSMCPRFSKIHISRTAELRSPELQISKTPDLQNSRTPKFVKLHIWRIPEVQNSRFELQNWRPPDLQSCRSRHIQMLGV